MEAAPAVWDSAEERWSEYQAVLLRSCWDYHRRLEEFLAWLTVLERAGTVVWNPVPLVRWNSHNRYLKDVAPHRVPVVPTRWLRQGGHTALLPFPTHLIWRAA